MNLPSTTANSIILENVGKDGHVVIIKQCMNCGKEIKVKPSLATRKKFCSKVCVYAWWKGKSRNPETQFKKGQRPHNYKGGRTTSRGYVLILKRGHYRANPNGYVSEHILVWEAHHQRMLPRNWVIHHINGTRNDNRIVNLVAMPREKHHPALDPGVIKTRVRELENELGECKDRYERLLQKTRNP